MVKDGPGHTRHAGFTLVELMVVVGLIGILATLSMMNARNALLTTRARGTATELGVIRVASQHLFIDCGSLPVWAATTDPGLITKPAWAVNCWRGAYLTGGAWPRRSLVGGYYQYIGTSKAKPIIRVRDIDQASARLLAVYIRNQHGAAALGGVGGAGALWYVDFIMLDAPTIP